MPLPPEKEFYTAAELATLLAVSKKTVDRMVQRGALPFHQIGRVRRFRRDDVEAFLAGCRTEDAVQGEEPETHEGDA